MDPKGGVKAEVRPGIAFRHQSDLYVVQVDNPATECTAKGS